MQIPYYKYFKNAHKNDLGFSLIELMVVVIIAGILAVGVVFMFANPSAQSKNQAFTLLGELNMARSEAVTRNEDVLVDFLSNVDGLDASDDGDPECNKDNIAQCTPGSGTYDGYIICIDLDSPADGECDQTDTIIRVTLFDEDVQYYDPTSLPADGPSTTPDGTASIIGKSGIILDDVTPTDIAHLSFEPDGSLEDGIAENVNVVVFVPKETHNVIYGTPYAVVIASSTGSIRIRRWTNGAWATK